MKATILKFFHFYIISKSFFFFFYTRALLHTRARAHTHLYYSLMCMSKYYSILSVENLRARARARSHSKLYFNIAFLSASRNNMPNSTIHYFDRFPNLRYRTLLGPLHIVTAHRSARRATSQYKVSPSFPYLPPSL